MSAVMRTSSPEEEEEARNKGLVRISFDEALNECKAIAYHWKPQTEVFWINYGALLPAFLAAIPGVVFTEKLRVFNKIPSRTGGRLLTIMPAALLAAGSSGYINYFAIEDILMNQTKCPVCLDSKTLLSQFVLGIVSPAAITLTGSTTYFATLHIRLPEILSRDYFRWVYDMFFRSRRLWFWSGGAQLGSTLLVLYMARMQWGSVNQTLYERMEQSGAVTSQTE
jgi:hypothetical protein